MRTEESIRQRLADIKQYIDTVPKLNLLRGEERIAFVGSLGAVEVLKWVLEEQEE